MGNIYCIANQKGGVGKTTTAINLAAEIATAGEETLLVDLDPQGNASSGLGVTMGSNARHVYHALIGEADAGALAVATPVDRLHLLPSGPDLVGAEVELHSVDGFEGFLRRALAPLRARYRFVFVDCPPSLGLLTLNALVAADSVVVPLQCEYYALEGLSSLLGTIERVRGGPNPDLALCGIVLTMFDVRNNLSHQVASEVRNHFDGAVFETVIPRNVRLSEAPSHGKPVRLYDPGSRGAECYRRFAEEFLRRAGGAA